MDQQRITERKIIGQRLNELRHIHGLSRQDVMDATGLSESSVKNGVLGGRTEYAGLNAVLKIARVLGCYSDSLHDFLDNDSWGGIIADAQKTASGKGRVAADVSSYLAEKAQKEKRRERQLLLEHSPVIGRRLKKLCRIYGLSRRDITNATGLSLGTVNKYFGAGLDKRFS